MLYWLPFYISRCNSIPICFAGLLFVTNIIGWWRWANPKPGEADKEKELKVSYMKKKPVVAGSSDCNSRNILLGQFASNLHEWFSNIFSKPSAYPYVDSFITVMSVLTFYMIEKKIESWVIWILVDVIATVLYYVKGVKFYSVEYFIFTIIAAYGLLHWIREYKSYAQQKA